MVVSKEQTTRNIRDGVEKRNPNALLIGTQLGMDVVGERKEIHKETKKLNSHMTQLCPSWVCTRKRQSCHLVKRVWFAAA